MAINQFQILVIIIFLAIFIPVNYKTIKYVKSKYAKKVQERLGFSQFEIEKGFYQVNRSIGSYLLFTSKLCFDSYIQRRVNIMRIGTILFLIAFGLVTYFG